MSDEIRSSDWDNPNFLIGDCDKNDFYTQEKVANIQSQINDSEKHWWLDFQFSGERILVIKQKPGESPPFIIHRFDNEKTKWILSPDASTWRLIPDSPVLTPKEKPKNWKMRDFIREIGHFPPRWDASLKDIDYESVVSGHYSILSLLLNFQNLKNSPQKDKFHQLIYHEGLILLKPFWDLSNARLEFARQIYSYSPLAQRASSKDHLWFFLEYSDCLQKLLPHAKPPSKDLHRTSITDFIRQVNKKLTKAQKGDYVELVTLERLAEGGYDWRPYINELLLNEAIRLVGEVDDDLAHDLTHHTRRYLKAWSDYNKVVGHKEPYKILAPDIADIPKPKKTLGRPVGSRNKKS